MYIILCGFRIKFSSKISAQNEWLCLSFAQFLEANIQHSCCVLILLLFMAYACNDLWWKLKTIYHNLVKGVRGSYRIFRRNTLYVCTCTCMCVWICVCMPLLWTNQNVWKGKSNHKVCQPIHSGCYGNSNGSGFLSVGTVLTPSAMVLDLQYAKYYNSQDQITNNTTCLDSVQIEQWFPDW